MNRLLNMAIYFNKIEEKEKAFGVFSYEKKIESLLSDIKSKPHALLISFIVDDETSSGIAEETPLKLKEVIGSLDINTLEKIKYNDFIEIFKNNNITNENEKNGALIFDMISLLMANYNGNASNIWSDSPSSSELKRRLLEFKGMNVRKANLFCLILVNKFKINLSDYSSINISNDRNIKKAMEQIKLIDSNASYEDMKYICKVLNPSFPGIFDSFFWAIGEYFFNNELSQEYIINDQDFIKKCIVASLEII